MFCHLTGSSSFGYENSKTSEPACYGSTYTSFVSLSCPLSEVVYPFEVYVGAKPNSTGCPDFENDPEYHGNDVLHKQCCRNINDTVDCIGEYNGPNRTRIIERCLGLSLCENKTHVVWESTYDMTCPAQYHYKSTTNYAYLKYYCIKSKTFILYIALFQQITTLTQLQTYIKKEAVYFLKGCKCQA